MAAPNRSALIRSYTDMPEGSAMRTAGNIISTTGSVLDAYLSYRSGKKAKAMSDYNAKLIEEQALMEQYAYAQQQEDLTDYQREMKAKQRMSVASRGGLMQGTDLMTIVEEAKQMRLDELELSRQREVARIRGESSAKMERFRGRQAERAGRWTAGTTLLKGLGQAAMIGMGGK